MVAHSIGIIPFLIEFGDCLFLPQSNMMMAARRPMKNHREPGSR
jgi:hypothetical protein